MVAPSTSADAGGQVAQVERRGREFKEEVEKRRGTTDAYREKVEKKKRSAVV